MQQRAQHHVIGVFQYLAQALPGQRGGQGQHAAGQEGQQRRFQHGVGAEEGAAHGHQLDVAGTQGAQQVHGQQQGQSGAGAGRRLRQAEAAERRVERAGAGRQETVQRESGQGTHSTSQLGDAARAQVMPGGAEQGGQHGQA